ncbi:cytosolic sulfotransferase 5 [Beta vulgaris subsp. vulgaris]|uniref:cytosolic sulfotransferase 5 n=1 Tax=Beta vulgaris subsp. vulgaris TaxID=3555 RepID=UPI00053F8BE5|nr:cytosolic sulfotransferase 5 [Beta vulgaris subsp. vulgaris]
MNQNQKQEEIIVSEKEAQQLKQGLPKATFIGSKIMKYQGFWYHENQIQNILAFQSHYCARKSDLFVASFPKTGTTWLKSLLFAIVNRVHYSTNHDQNPILANHPHELVYSLETDVYSNAFVYPRPHHLDELSSPRLLSTHLPYSSLPESIKTSGCKIVYITRNPLDTLVSLYHFSMKVMKKYFSMDVMKMILGMFYQTPSLEDFFEAFCEERIPFGPFFDHVAEYWKASSEQPDKVLFLKYEELKDDPILHVKRLAEFVGSPFTTEEESDGVIEQIIEMCSIKNMKELEANKSGVINKLFEKQSYFRKGEVGDWTHYFTPPMVEKMKKIMDEKLEGTGLSFNLLP